LSDEALHLAGVQTATAALSQFGGTIRTVGTVVPDETRVRHVHTKVSGWIEKLYVNFTGQMVHKGKAILSLYSPELLSSQQEFLRAREAADRFAKSDMPEVRQGGKDLLDAARRRLELFDVPVGFIDDLEKTGEARRTVTLLAPVTGFVTAKQVFEGHEVEPGMELFTVTDLSNVWIEADFYEYEVRDVRVGQEATLTLAYDPAVRFSGKVTYVYPTINPDSRTLKVRFEVPNRDLKLKPAMYVNVELALEAREGIVFTDSAVLDSGIRQIVFVETSAGHFEPREVRVAGRSDGNVLVESGVAAGEKVVTRANFLLDSESRLRAAISTGSGASKQEGTGQ
jgi:Cu(I)/Ag(I) efflux system membrane fusion protein